MRLKSLLLLTPLLILLAWWCLPAPIPRATTPGPDWSSQAYLWQRAWTDSVRDAVRQEAPAFTRLVVLARQIEWPRQTGRTIRVAVDWPSLKSTGIPIAAAIRINPYSGPFDGPASDYVCNTVRDLAAEAAAAGVPLAEIQIDFDAATSKLPDYRRWLARARGETRIPITFTAVPTWMDSPAFAPMARDAGYFVLQVHWLAPPRRLADPLVLCDIPTARRALERAGRIGVPFRVALPTYGYVAAFHADGSFAAIAAEDAPPDWGAGMSLRSVEANAAELAPFVEELARNRPASMRGIIWYRLPIGADRWNWSWPTLQAVMQGRPPRPAALSVQFADSDGVSDILLTNTGEQGAPLRAIALRITWTAAERIAADGLEGFEPDAISNTALLFHPPPETFARMKPGTSIHVGWVRLTTKAQLHAEIEEPPPQIDTRAGDHGNDTGG